MIKAPDINKSIMTTVIREEFSVQWDDNNKRGYHAVAVIKDDVCIVGHVCTLFCFTLMCITMLETWRLFETRRLLVMQPNLHPVYQYGRGLFKGGFYSWKYGVDILSGCLICPVMEPDAGYIRNGYPDA